MLTLYTYHEVQMLLPDAVPHDLPLPVAFTRHGQPLYCAISIDAISAAKVAAEIEVERLANCSSAASYRADKSRINSETTPTKHTQGGQA